MDSRIDPAAVASVDPVPGGVLRVATTEVFDTSDPADARHPLAGQLHHALSRQLFGYPAVTQYDPVRPAFTPVADLAAHVPTVRNGGLSPDGLVWTIALRPDVTVDAAGSVALTATDVVRGFARLAAEGAADPLRERLLELVRQVSAADARTVRIVLCHPAGEFLHLLAGSALVPMGGGNLGPYRMEPGQGAVLRLRRNPVWRAATDVLRAQFAEEIQIRTGCPAVAMPPPGTDLAWSREPSDRGMPAVGGLGWSLDAYLVANLCDSGPLRRREVRRALAYAVDKLAVLEAMSVPAFASRLQHTLLTPDCVGHRPVNPYPTDGDRGDPPRSRAILERAGVRGRVGLTMLVRDDPRHQEAADIIAIDGGKAGFDVTVVPLPDRRLDERLRAEDGRWDLALCSWRPDWYGPNGSTALVPLTAGQQNYGGYHSDAVGRLVAAARQAGDAERAETLWYHADLAVMRDLPVFPLVATADRVRQWCSPRVRNVHILPQLGCPDLTTAWLAPRREGLQAAASR